MNKKYRQYIGLAVAVLMYYIIHEGVHLVVALVQGVFRQINFMGLGVQIDVLAERMCNEQMGIFYRWVGGGDMNGIALSVPEGVASLIAGVVGVVNLLLVWKVLYPAYTASFKNVA